jgi:EmrB/QacA subfamily drug resistance transporter
MSVWNSNRRLVLVVTVVLSAIFMANVDLWIVNLALVAMGRSFGGSLAGLSWVVNAYAVMLAAVLIPAGRLGDRIGHRRVFLVGTALFALASVGCALAPNIVLLVVARVAQAAGAAAQIPTSLALLLAAVPEQRRLSAARGWSAVGAVAAVAGPVIGGLLIEYSWRWVFLVNLPIGLAAWLLGRRILPRPPTRGREPLPDLAGSALLILGLGTLTGALVQAPEWGWANLRTVGLIAVAVVGIGLFLWRCRTHPTPILDLPLLRIRRFTMANLAVVSFGASFAINLLSNSLWCQEVWHYSALRTGLAMTPGPAMVPLATLASSRLIHRYGPGPVAAAGSALFAVGQLYRVFVAGVHPAYARDLLPSLIATGIGVGLTLGTLIAAGATALPPERSATGSAVINSVRQVASALGIAALITILGTQTSSVVGYRVAWDTGAALALASAICCWLLDTRRGSRPGASRETARLANGNRLAWCSGREPGETPCLSPHSPSRR